MLTGLLTPTSGGARVYGLDLAAQMADIRQLTGVCAQQDVLFPALTVREHLVLFAELKGAQTHEIDAMVHDAINDVQLSIETNQAAGELSGGQKRRLCLAIALIAGSRVVFLDEPTSGV